MSSDVFGIPDPKIGQHLLEVVKLNHSIFWTTL